MKQTVHPRPNVDIAFFRNWKVLIQWANEKWELWSCDHSFGREKTSAVTVCAINFLILNKIEWLFQHTQTICVPVITD